MKGVANNNHKEKSNGWDTAKEIGLDMLKFLGIGIAMGLGEGVVGYLIKSTGTAATSTTAAKTIGKVA